MTTGAADGRRARVRASAIAVAIVFGLLFAYDFFEALTNLLGVSQQISAANEFAEENGLPMLQVPWAILAANLLLPAASFAIAWRLGRGRSILIQALVFFAGLAFVAALTLTLTTLVST